MRAASLTPAVTAGDKPTRKSASRTTTPQSSIGGNGCRNADASMNVPAYPYPPYPESTRGKVDNPDHRYPFASEAITTGIR